MHHKAFGGHIPPKPASRSSHSQTPELVDLRAGASDGEGRGGRGGRGGKGGWPHICQQIAATASPTVVLEESHIIVFNDQFIY